MKEQLDTNVTYEMMTIHFKVIWHLGDHSDDVQRMFPLQIDRHTLKIMRHSVKRMLFDAKAFSRAVIKMTFDYTF